MRRSALIFAACVSFAFGISPSFADDRSDCTSPGDASKRIAACSKLVKAGKLKGTELAIMLEARGRAFLALGQRDQAIADFNEGIRIGPSSDLYADRGELQLESKAYDRAMADFDEAIRLAPKSKSNYLLRGKTHAAQQSFGLAIRDFDEAIRLDGGLSNVGTSALKEKQRTQAAFILKEATDVAPACLDAAAAPELRIEGCKRIIAAGKIGADVVIGLVSKRAVENGDNEKIGDAISDASVIIGFDPDNIEMLQLRGLGYLVAREFDLALADFNQLVRAEPSNEAAKKGRAATLFEKGDYDSAIAQLNEVLRASKDADALTYRGRAYAAKRDYVRALLDYDEALRVEPSMPDIKELREAARSALAAERRGAAAAPPVVAKEPANNQQVAAVAPAPPPDKPATLPEKFIGKRVALVMGNGAYRNVPKLENPIIDARTMRDVLTRLGFEVIYGENLDKRAMGRQIGEFSSIVRDADAAIVYFAGHGSTFADIPYVVPIDSKYEKLADIPSELVPVESMVGELRRAKGVRLVILDACRDNEREVELRRQEAASRGEAKRGGAVSRGLGKLQNPDGLIVVYSTQHMTTASDGDAGGNSPFTGALAKHLVSPGLDIKDVLFRAGQDVIAKTGGTQRPEISISLYEPFVLAQ